MEILVTIMKYAAAIALGYLLGCADAAWLAARLAGKDVKKMGNGNVGASNVAMSMGVFPGVLVATWDIFKAVLAGMAAAYILQAPVLACVLSAAMAVVGHVYPFWLGFDGGKGFAPYVGFVVFMDWRLAVILAVIAVVAVSTKDRIVYATITFGFGTPVATLWRQGMGPRGFLFMGIALILSTILWDRHQENIARLRDGTEPRVSEVLKGKYKGGKGVGNH